MHRDARHGGSPQAHGGRRGRRTFRFRAKSLWMRPISNAELRLSRGQLRPERRPCSPRLARGRQLAAFVSMAASASLARIVRRALSTAKPKRFYKEASVVMHAPADGTVAQYAVALDGRTVKTPGKELLAVRSRPLALAIAEEWDAQGKYIRPQMMPLTTLATTTIDQMPSIREQIEEGLLSYFKSDTVCFRTPGAEPTLAQREREEWDPLMAWFNERFGTSIESTTALALDHSAKDVDRIEDFLLDADDEVITALDAVAASCKSFVIAAAVTLGRLDARGACAAARVAEDTQIEQWGLAEGSHDIDIEDQRIRVGAAAVYSHLCRRAGAGDSESKDRPQS